MTLSLIEGRGGRLPVDGAITGCTVGAGASVGVAVGIGVGVAVGVWARTGKGQLNKMIIVVMIKNGLIPAPRL